MTTNPPRQRRPTGRRLIPAADVGDRLGGRLHHIENLFADRDRLMGQAARALVEILHDDQLAARLGGMSLQVWLEHVCRIPGSDARALLGAIDSLVHLPAVVTGLCDRWLSWPQVQAIAAAARRVPVARLPELDGLVESAMVDHFSFEPDALVAEVWAWVDQLQPSRLEQAEKAAERGEFVSLSPRLFGGGSLYGEFGPAGFATIAEAVAAPLGPPVEVPDDLDADAAAELFDTLDEQRRQRTKGHGARMARQLVDLCEQSLAGQRADSESVPSRPLLLATTSIDALLDRDRTPGWLLHTLAGGRMQVSSGLLQRLLDERGADLRTIVLDDCGQVVGVGRKAYLPPHWLRQAIWARDSVVSDPDGSCPIRTGDLDHIREWPDGATDVDNLHALGRRWHNHKTSKTWTVKRQPDGTTTWRHKRHGWLLRLAPAQRTLHDPPRAGPPRSPPDVSVN
jgi:hypothetical protein